MFPTMIDIQLLRKDIDAVAARLKTRKFELDVNAFNALESERRQLQTQTEEMQARRNSLSKQIGILKGKKEDASAVMAEVSGIGDQLKANEVALAEVQAKLSEFMLSIPNVPHESVPVGQDESANVEVRRIGTPREFDFEVRDHVDIGTPLGLDFETATKLTGARFVSCVARWPVCIERLPSSCWICKRPNMVIPNVTRHTWQMLTVYMVRASYPNSRKTSLLQKKADRKAKAKTCISSLLPKSH